MVKISVVMGVYNAGPALRGTLESILGQTERDLELIAVDDGSTVADAAMLDEYAARDARVRVLRRGHNLGLTRSLIEGCGAARGTFIARHDAGDVSLPRRLEIESRLFEDDPELVFVSCATQYAGPELEPLYVVRPTGAASAPAYIIDLAKPAALSDGPTHHGSVLFRRDAYERAGGYRPEFYYGQDFDLWYRLAEAGKFQAVDEVLYTARLDPASITTAARRQQERLAALSRAALEARRTGGDDAAILAEAARVGRVTARSRRRRRGAGLYFIGEALRKNGDVRARRYLSQSLLVWPLSLRSWVRYLQSLLL